MAAITELETSFYSREYILVSQDIRGIYFKTKWGYPNFPNKSRKLSIRSCKRQKKDFDGSKKGQDHNSKQTL